MSSTVMGDGCVRNILSNSGLSERYVRRVETLIKNLGQTFSVEIMAVMLVAFSRGSMTGARMLSELEDMRQLHFWNRVPSRATCPQTEREPVLKELAIVAKRLLGVIPFSCPSA